MKNYCGGKGSIIKPPYAVFFNASCKKHDEGYKNGGDEARRIECDTKFLAMMLKDVYKQKKNIYKLYYALWAILYFFAVRIFGKKYFNYFIDK